MYYLYIVIWGSFWLILYSEWYRCRETELFVAVTVRLMEWTLANNSLYLRWLLYLLCSLYSLIIFSIYVCIHIHYNSVENLHWQKLTETCFCRTGLNRGLNHLRQKPANPGQDVCQCCGNSQILCVSSPHTTVDVSVLVKICESLQFCKNNRAIRFLLGGQSNTNVARSTREWLDEVQFRE